MKPLLAPVALLLLLGFPGAKAQRPHPFDLLSSVAVDGTGRVVGTDPIDPGTLRVWEDGAWRPWNLREHFQPWSPLRSMSLANGNSATLWHRGVDQWMIVWSRGTAILGKQEFSWENTSTNPFLWTEAANGSLWLSSKSPQLIEIKPPQASEEKLSLARVWDLRPWMENPHASSWPPLHVVADNTSGIWVWNYIESQTVTRLRNFLHLPAGADTWQTGPAFPKGMEPPIRFVGNGPKGALWISDSRGRLFTLEPASGSIRDFSPPPPHPLIGMARTWFDRDGGIFVLAGTSTKPGLWHWNENGWRTIVPPEKLTFVDQYRTRQSLLELQEGLLMGAREGIIWIPRKEEIGGDSPWGEARPLNWESGFPLVRVEQILILPDGTIGVRASREAARRWWSGTLNDLLQGGKPASRVEFIRPHTGWSADAEDRVYTFLHAQPESLQEWSDGVWRDIPLPQGVNSSRLALIDIDARQRIVIFSHDCSEPVLLLENDRETWRVFPDYFTFLLQLGSEAEGLQSRSREWRPAIAPSGQIAFLDRLSTLHLWNGVSWQQWKMKDFFTPARLASDLTTDDKRPWLQEAERRLAAERFGAPFVAKNGSIAVNTLHSNHSWFWTAEGDWMPGKRESGPDDPLLNPPPNLRQNEIPRGAKVPGRPRSVAEDNLGTTWIVAGGNLYRFRDGQTMPVFSEDEVHPFLSEPSLEDVRVDRKGFVWLSTSSHAFDHVLLHPTTIPDFQPRLTRDKNYLVSLAPSPPAPLEWSKDGRTWFPTRGNSLGFVPPDVDQIMLRLIAGDLSVHPLIPQKIPDFGSMEDFWTHLLGILIEGTYEEKVLAVESCERNPRGARTMLTEALESGKFQDDWWLRTALQATGAVDNKE